MRPRIVCLCGSTRFRDAFQAANREETLQGKIVLSVGLFGHGEDKNVVTEEIKARLDRLHLEKIRLSDEILVLNVEGHIGESTAREIACALYLGRSVRFLEKIKGETYLEDEAHTLGRRMQEISKIVWGGVG